MPSLLQIPFTVLASCLWLSLAQAGQLCPVATPQSNSEGEWRIPEEAITEQAAKQELKKLKQLFGPSGLTAESVAWETSFVIIEGWYLKRQALEAKKRGEDGLPISDFCDFMKNSAYVRH